MALRKFPQSAAYWTACGTGPGGNTIEEARDRVRKEMDRIGIEHLTSKVKFRITKTVEVEEVAEEVMGNEASFFMLKD
jgi:hypothetical protein